jgi:hypothetical protein
VTFANFRNKVVIFEGSLLAKSEVTVLDNFLITTPHLLPVKVFVAGQDFQQTTFLDSLHNDTGDINHNLEFECFANANNEWFQIS